jgi:hypothetical protein
MKIFDIFEEATGRVLEKYIVRGMDTAQLNFQGGLCVRVKLDPVPIDGQGHTYVVCYKIDQRALSYTTVNSYMSIGEYATAIAETGIYVSSAAGDIWVMPGALLCIREKRKG